MMIVAWTANQHGDQYFVVTDQPSAECAMSWVRQHCWERKLPDPRVWRIAEAAKNQVALFGDEVVRVLLHVPTSVRKINDQHVYQRVPVGV